MRCPGSRKEYDDASIAWYWKITCLCGRDSDRTSLYLQFGLYLQLGCACCWPLTKHKFMLASPIPSQKQSELKDHVDAVSEFLQYASNMTLTELPPLHKPLFPRHCCE